MYKIIGADGKEYGPITAEQLKQWIAEGRANQQTKVLVDGETEWKTIAEIPEFAAGQFVPPPPTPVVPASLVSASDQVKAPAIALIVVASLGIAYYLFNAVVTLALGGAMFQHEMPSNVPPELRTLIQGMRGPLSGIVSLAIVALNAFVLLGAVKMMRLQSYGLAMAACIIAMLPCQCCCVLGLPFGIWALVVLNKPEVKSSFM